MGLKKMARDMHKEEWDSTTLTKLQVFEEYVHEWLNVVLNYKKDETIEIYDLFCGSGYDGAGTRKGSPLRILDSILERDLKGKQVRVYLNDKDEDKIKQLEDIIKNEYPNLQSNNIEVKLTHVDTKDYKFLSKSYFKLVFLDQYGIEHIDKINEILKGGVDILIFVSSGHIRRFLEQESFQKYLDSKCIQKEDFKDKSSYETHRVIAEYFRKKFEKCFISPFSLVKNNRNVNGIIFISTHQKGQEQFLKTAWRVDTDFGEGNANIDRDLTRENGTLFYDKSAQTNKEKKFEESLREFLKEYRSNLEIKAFSLNNGFLLTHTNKILEKNNKCLEYKYYGKAKRGFHLNNKEKKVEVRYINETH